MFLGVIVPFVVSDLPCQCLHCQMLTFMVVTHFGAAPASGGSIDWTLSRNPKLYSLAFELRPSGYATGDGFLLPSSEIIPTGEELHASLVVLAKEMRT